MAADIYRGREYGNHARQAQELAEVRGLHEPHTDPDWVSPLDVVNAAAMDRATSYPLDGPAPVARLFQLRPNKTTAPSADTLDAA